MYPIHSHAFYWPKVNLKLCNEKEKYDSFTCIFWTTKLKKNGINWVILSWNLRNHSVFVWRIPNKIQTLLLIICCSFFHFLAADKKICLFPRLVKESDGKYLFCHHFHLRWYSSSIILKRLCVSCFSSNSLPFVDWF